MAAAAFDIFHRLLIANFNFLLCFWHINLSSVGVVVVVSAAIAPIDKETAPRN
jgi:hypothetical protein